MLVSHLARVCSNNTHLAARHLSSFSAQAQPRITELEQPLSGVAALSPCVLTWEQWHGSTVPDLVRLHNDCWKACIESSPGTRRRMPHNMSLWINGYELERYTRLQSLRDNKNLYMTCGGRWNDHIYWSKKCNNMPASCGRCIPTDDLHSTDSSWTKTPNAKIWFCKECRNRKCSPWEGNFTKKDENIISRWIEGY